MTKKLINATVKVASTKNLIVEVLRNWRGTSTIKLPINEGKPQLDVVRERQLRKVIAQAWAEYAAALVLNTKPAYYIEVASHRAAPTNAGVGGGRYPVESNGALQGWFLAKSVVTLVDEPHVARVFKNWGVRLVSGLVMVSKTTGKVLWEPSLTQVSGLLWSSIEEYKSSLDEKGRIANVGSAEVLKHRTNKARTEWYEDPRAYTALGVSAPYASKH